VFQPQAGFDLVDEEPGVYVFGAHANVNIMAWVGSATAEITDRYQHIVARQVPASPRGLSTVHIMTAMSTPPTPEARRGFAEIARRYESSIVCASLVIEREGFWGSAMRSAITGIQLLLAPGDYPIKVHASIYECASWMPRNHSARSGIKLDPALLLGALAGVRNRALDHAKLLAPEVSHVSEAPRAAGWTGGIPSERPGAVDPHRKGAA
jgi:hypothetical protein